MSYFSQIIDRTLSSGHQLVRPAVTPDSIPESPVNAKGDRTNKVRRYTPSENNVKGPPISAIAVEGKEDSSQNHATGIELKGQEEKGQASHREITLAAEPQTLVGPANSREDDSDSIPRQPPEPKRVQERQELSIAEMESKNLQIDRVGAETGPVAEISEIQYESEKPSKFTQVQKPHENDMPLTHLKTGNDDQQRHPPLVPANTDTTRFSFPVRETEETVVTINIGRIEVMAEQQSEPARRPRQKFSPSLSLADYLKQRSEGKMG